MNNYLIQKVFQKMRENRIDDKTALDELVG